MVASKNTVSEVYDVIRRHVGADIAGAMLVDLIKVKGNASFTRTCELLLLHHQRQPECLGPDVGCVGCGILSLPHPRNSTCPLRTR